MPDRRTALRLFAAASALALPSAAFASVPQVYASGGLALGGTDPVAYFREGRPVAGLRSQALMWRGATWLFASAENRVAFEMNPEAHAPCFGGYCAFAMSRGSVAPTIPEAWAIHRDRLYLTRSLPVKALWSEDIPGNVALAEQYWPQVFG